MSENKKITLMCMVSINVDEAALRDMCPELDTTAAIRLWAQLPSLLAWTPMDKKTMSEKLVDLRMQQMRMEGEKTMDVEEAHATTHRAVSREYALERDMTPEELYAVIMEDVKEIYEDDSI